MKRQLVAAIVVMGLVTTACGTATTDSQRADPQGTGHLATAPHVVMARPAAQLDLRPLALGNRQLGYALATRFAAQHSNGNLVSSPASLSIGFSMLREGARGQAAAMIDRVLHLPADRHSSYNALVCALQAPGPGNVLDVGNGLFIDPSLTVRRSFLVALKKWYGAGVVQTRFPTPAKDVINSYVDTNTHGRIPALIKVLDPSAVFALVNTVYLNAKWQTPFDPTETADASFTTQDRSTITVNMMHSTGTTDYARGPGWQAVRLPYRGDRLSMWVMLPTAGANAVSMLAPEVLTAADKGFRPASVDLSLPRWNIDNNLDLTTTLKSMGLDIFGSGDFSGVTPDPGFFISQVLQQANITVGEKGTVAAAATAIIGDEVSGQVPDGVSFDADHPFAFAVVDNTTGTPLFEGTVSDPASEVQTRATSETTGEGRTESLVPGPDLLAVSPD